MTTCGRAVLTNITYVPAVLVTVAFAILLMQLHKWSTATIVLFSWDVPTRPISHASIVPHVIIGLPGRAIICPLFDTACGGFVYGWRFRKLLKYLKSLELRISAFLTSSGMIRLIILALAVQTKFLPPVQPENRAGAEGEGTCCFQSSLHFCSSKYVIMV